MPNLSNTIKKVENFANLAIGWRFGKGMPIDSKKIEIAKELLELGETHGIERFNAFAGDEGELMISFYYLEKNIDLTLKNNGSITFAEDIGDEEIDFIPNLNYDAAIEKICQFAQNTREPFTQKIMTLRKGNLKAYPSNPRQTVVYPFLKRFVGLRKSERYANTSKRITMRELGIPQYTGKSQVMIFPKDAHSFRA